MRALLRTLKQLSINANTKATQFPHLTPFLAHFSTRDGSGNKEPDWATHFGGTGSSGADSLGWDVGTSSWSTGLTKEHFDGEVIGQKVTPDPPQTQSVPGQPGSRAAGRSGRDKWYSEATWTDQEMAKMKELEAENRKTKAFLASWDGKMVEMTDLMKQVGEHRFVSFTVSSVSISSFSFFFSFKINYSLVFFNYCEAR